MNKKRLSLSMAFVALMLSACGSGKTAHGEEKLVDMPGHGEPSEYVLLDESQRTIVEQNNAFALDLFRKIDGFESKVVSPLSVSYLMGILANGADGQTRQEILRTLGNQDLSLNDLNALCRMLMEKSGKLDPSATINIANYVAVNKHYRLKSGFVKSMEDYYKAGVESLDFTSPSTLGHINGWCKKQTDGMIPSIIDDVDPSAVSYLMNAIFFNGSWQDKFDKNDTKLENFQGYTRDIKKVQMMHRSDKMLYASNDMFSAVKLPFGNGSYSMTVLLPNADKSISEMLAALDARKVAKLEREMDFCVVDLKLPRFSTEYELSLNKLVSELGASSMFSPAANFANFADGSFCVSKMLQKAKVEVNEEGAKAAAVTAAVVALTALNPDEPRHVEFHARRPFVYLITESGSGAIFFMGEFLGD